ncbi:hypothetical protein HN51_013297 [Arachis hypogaea]|uniref:Homeobox domain-containing protein n=3 Tax=Arachis TaxID=3817 RepID=A0A445DQU3_ARAHY|nr:WUSCHEL-related homeobox 8-like [Arachis duranensis]RYR65555.1 hypothetical protein Ahy_A03g011488 [Arachis hypogaea]
MASSNRHWPSMFKSKPCNQFQHDMVSTTTASCHRSAPYNPISGLGCDEKSPEPKPRWNPKPEQIRILEAIFNSGMVNPPRDEIRKIRMQLQEYGQVGDANVFYWFQNRKSRSKHKLRHLTNNNSRNNNTPSPSPPPPLPPQQQFISATTNSSSSSSSDKSSPKFVPAFTDVVMLLPNSPTASVNQNYFHHNDTNNNNTINHLLVPPPLPIEPFFPVFHNSSGVVATTEISNSVGNHHQPPHLVYQENVDPCTDLLLSEIMSHGGVEPSSKRYHEQDKAAATVKIRQPQQYISFCPVSTPPPSFTNTTATPITVPSPFQGAGGGCGSGDASAAKCTVYINDMACEVDVGPFNVRHAFGDEAVLIDSSGHTVLTDDWGVTLHPLQHGFSYYLIWFLSFFLSPP